jgi:hypothetical protein
MLLLVSASLRTYPLALPQVTSLVTGVEPLDRAFQQKWNACLEWIGQRLFAPTRKNGDALEREEADELAGRTRVPMSRRRKLAAKEGPMPGA